MQTFREITWNPHRYRYNTTVMAGAGAVPYFQEAHWLSEEIISVEGTFSGTLAYVCSELQKWEKPLSLIVREAQEKGYTEPHPIDDLGGEDVRRKLLILLRSAGISIEEDEVNLRGLIDPRKYNSMDPQAFLNSITQEDADMRARVEGARKNWLVPRYVGSFKDGLAQVWLQFVPIDSDLGSLQWTANKVLIHTSQRTPEGSAPHVIQSPGAGVIKTAAAVRADLLYLLSGTNLWQHS
jgi:aspartokinase/homoserine dehydrogenase 1